MGTLYYEATNVNATPPLTAQIGLVTRHQYGISALIPQKSIRKKTRGIVKCWVFSEAAFDLNKFLTC